jgi:DNA helicase-2/ATP-dependent DNA helicase PcrA
MPFGGAYQNFGGTFGSGFTKSRFEEAATPFDATYETPGWQRAKAQTQKTEWSPREARRKRGPLTIDGELVAASTEEASFKRGERVMHQKFGAGTVADVDGNKLTIDFDDAGRKRVLDSFVARA